MATALLDRNVDACLVLECGLGYRPMVEGEQDAPVDDTIGPNLLKQHHYVARAHAVGLVVTSVDRLLDGWEQVNHWRHVLGRNAGI